MDSKHTDQSATALLQFVRAATRWSEPRIAKKLGVSQPTVNRILNGQSDCKGSTLQAIRKLHQQISQQLTSQQAQHAKHASPDSNPAHLRPSSHHNDRIEQ
jgi:transcriptional regulator with XRE-family HTH domain